MIENLSMDILIYSDSIFVSESVIVNVNITFFIIYFI